MNRRTELVLRSVKNNELEQGKKYLKDMTVEQLRESLHDESDLTIGEKETLVSLVLN